MRPGTFSSEFSPELKAVSRSSFLLPLPLLLGSSFEILVFPPGPIMASPAAPVAPVAPVPIGLAANGTPVFASFQPSVASLAISLTPHLKTLTDIGAVLPLPTGLQLVRSPDLKQIQLKIAPFFARKMKRVFGYVAEIVLSEGAGANSPAHLQIASRVPWRYGSTSRGMECSWVLVRIQAFTSKALFETAARVVSCALDLVLECVGHTHLSG